MQSYETFARFYDPVQGDRAEHAAYVRTLIDRHHPAARTVLELACGTGSILKQLQPDFEVTGVDLSPTMLAIAAEKVPEARLVHADMTKVSLGETFDVVLCLYDSINHLLVFEQWESLFDRAREHLSDRGVFVFDINTEYRLGELAAQPQQAIRFGNDDLLLIDVVDAEVGGVVDWHLQVFRAHGGVDLPAPLRAHPGDVVQRREDQGQPEPTVSAHQGLRLAASTTVRQVPPAALRR